MTYVINDPLIGTPKIQVSASSNIIQPWLVGSYRMGEYQGAANYVAKADDPYLGTGTFVYMQNQTANTAGATVSSITYSASPTVTNTFLATVTTASAHSLTPGTKVILTGVVPVAYNGTYIVNTTPSTTTFTISVVGVTSNATTAGSYSYSTIRPGVWVAFAPVITAGYAVNVGVLWDGVNNTGRPIGVAATALLQNEYGWVQVQGLAIANVNSATATVGSALYSTGATAGYAATTATAGRQIIGAYVAGAIGVTVGAGNDAFVLPSATTTSAQCVALLNNPNVQTQIT